MKNKFKIISFSLLVVLLLGLSFGCSPTDDVEDEVENVAGLDEDIFMESGFLDSKYIEDGKELILIETNEEMLELEIKDNELFDELEPFDYYMVSYNDEKIVRSIKSNEFIKNLILESEEVTEDEDPIIISKDEKYDTEGLTLLDSFIVDINDNGEDETISMYTSAEKGPDGEVMWDDGQDWTILVQAEDGDYVLFDEYVQIGSLDFFVYTIEEDFYITTIQAGTANLDMVEYKFNRGREEFEASVEFTTEGNVIMLHQSN